MSQWHVELTSKDTILLAFLTTCLQEPSCTVIEKISERYYVLEQDVQHLYRSSDLPEARKDNHYYWLSTDFDKYTNAQDVLMYAQQQVPLLNSILRLKYGIHISSLNVDDVYRVDEQDRLVKETALFPPLTGRRVTSESLLQAANEQHPSITAIWLATRRREPLIKEVLYFYAKQPSWSSLYNVYKLIESDTEENTFKDKTKGWGKRFTQTANNFNASKFDARHPSVEATELSPRFKAMSLHEALNHISSLLTQWLQTNLS